MFVKRFSPLGFLALTAGLGALSGVAPAAAQVARPATAIAVDEMSRAAGGGISSTVAANGLVGFLRTEPGAPIPLREPGSAEERAREFLDDYGDAFGLVPGVEMVAVGESPTDEVGMEHVRFRQTYRGVPIAGGEMAVHLRGQGVVAVHAKTLPDLRGVDLVPRVTAEEAEVLARDALARHLGVVDAVLSAPRLELLNKGLLGGRGFATELTWFVEARKIDLREYLWIDARAGKVALQFSQLTDAREREIYDADDPGDGSYGSLPGALVRSEGGPAVVGAAATDANAAYDYASQLDLSSLAGTAFSYGFVLASDSSVDEFGWWVDDVRIYTCAECLATRTLDAGYTGTASHYKAASSITAGDGFTVEHGDSVTLEAGSVVLTSGFRAVGDLTVIAGAGSCP